MESVDAKFSAPCKDGIFLKWYLLKKY